MPPIVPGVYSSFFFACEQAGTLKGKTFQTPSYPLTLARRLIKLRLVRAILLKRPTPARGPLGWFFGRFNRGFDRITSGYGGIVNFLIRKAGRSMLLLVVVVGGIWLLSQAVPGGFIPDEDKGLLFVAVELPEGASLQRTDAVLKKAEQIVAETKGVRSVCAISGFNILTGLNMAN